MMMPAAKKIERLTSRRGLEDRRELAGQSFAPRRIGSPDAAPLPRRGGGICSPP